MRMETMAKSKVLELPSKEVLLKVMDLIGNDGHSIWAADGLRKCGLPEAWIKQFSQVHKSKGSWMETIYVNGKAVSELGGVYGLSLLSVLASRLNAQVTRHYYGRGSEACELTKVILAKLGEWKAAGA
jgi:hypothetical protein